MRAREAVSPLTLNRLSVYLRCLRRLEEEGVTQISSRALADRFHLSSSQIRKDLAQFGEFGIRGVGYDVAALAESLETLLGLDRHYRMVVVGMGNLGSSLARYMGFNSGAFRVVAGVDNDPERIGTEVGDFTVRSTEELAAVVAESGARIGVLAVPPEAAQENYDRLVEAGVEAILNFAPARIKRHPDVALKNVDMRINLEELAFLLREE